MSILLFFFTEKRPPSPFLLGVCRQRPHSHHVYGLARLLRQVRLHEQQVHQHRLSPRHHHRRVHLRHVHVVLLLAPGQTRYSTEKISTLFCLFQFCGT